MNDVPSHRCPKWDVFLDIALVFLGVALVFLGVAMCPPYTHGA
jgi:hypothetical protein